MIVCWQAMSCDARLETPPALPHEDSDSSSFSYSSDDDDLCDEADHLSLPPTSSLLHSALTRIASGNEYGTSREGHAGNDRPTSAPIQDRNEQSDATMTATSIEQPQPREVSATLGKYAEEASTCDDDAMSFSDDNDESSKAALLSSEDSDDEDDGGDDEDADDASEHLGDDRQPSDEEEIELESDDEEDEESEEDEEEENEEEKEMEEEGEGSEKTESEGKDADSEKQDKGEELFKIGNL